ncbi:indolepyruvate oxidoreductase subunit beta [Marispirochaeta sp.]|jgi:indolepyruvate ferredoxin oxidoreductase beta subunit|uniref:indolepyruvate oxidoreductase subunit beta n=1 Tax=Marispirochaeta sp. TaxID=2038653 RepID=UPI0029C71C75|nr:indolepyruvate oxidoreductase subunit beta [Marispirochaeta sp.]
MKYDIILAGVGGQGTLSVAAIIASAALKQGLVVRQSEIHGMSQRGGAVVSHLRLSDSSIDSDLIPLGNGDLLLSMEPLEALRHIEYLSPTGRLISAAEGVNNIPVYPRIESIHEAILAQPGARVIDARSIAKDAGSLKAMNIVMIGSAADSIPITQEHFLSAIDERFFSKGDKVQQANRKAFEISHADALGAGS